MNLLLRWLRFNLVGVVGTGVQLSSLWCLNRLLGGRYLAASALALELTLLHNFLWHTRYTWRDVPGERPPWKRLLRFHLSNGLVSLAGNLALMRLLVQRGHLPLLAANAIAILGCSVVNFWLGHVWAFGPAGDTRGSGTPASTVSQGTASGRHGSEPSCT